MKGIAILGSTGSIGCSALAVVDAHPDQLRIVGLAAGSNASRLAEQISTYTPAVAALSEADAAGALRRQSVGTRIVTGPEALIEVPLASPFSHRYVWHVPAHLDVDGMRDAARRIEGTRDFACFQSTGGTAATSVRTMFRSELTFGAAAVIPGYVPEPALVGSGLLVYRVTGNGFLRHMVRAIVGTLVEIGRQAAGAPSMDALLTAGRRAQAGPTAPACGLCLSAVSYDPPDVATQR